MRVGMREASKQFAATVNPVVYGGRRVILTRHGRDVAAIIPIADLARVTAKAPKTKTAKRG